MYNRPRVKSVCRYFIVDIFTHYRSPEEGFSASIISNSIAKILGFININEHNFLREIYSYCLFHHSLIHSLGNGFIIKFRFQDLTFARKLNYLYYYYTLPHHPDISTGFVLITRNITIML